MEELENLLASKDKEIHTLMDTIDALNNVINLKESDGEEENEDSIEINVEDIVDEDGDIFTCDDCDFITRKKTGLRIQRSRVYSKAKCANCNREFSSKREAQETCRK